MWKEVARRARSTVHKVVPALEVQRAAVLDGAHLWLTLDAPHEGRIVALSAATERATTFSAPVPTGLRTVLLDLGELPGDEEEFDLLFDATGPRRPLRRATTSPDQATQAPYPPVGRWHHRIVTHDGVLVLQRRPAPPVRSVRHLTTVDDAIEVAWQGAAGDEFGLTGEEGEALAIPTEQGDGHRVHLAASAFPAATITAGAVVRNGADTVRLVRAHNDLVRPNAAVVLPEVETAAGTLRLTWAQDGALQVIWKAAR